MTTSAIQQQTSAAGRTRRDRRWLTPLQAGLAGGAIAILAFGGGFGTAYAVAAASASTQVPVVQLEMSEGLPGGG
ncbi:hypothetical protein ACFWHR_01325 [Leucobacter sp. NPDC058333]|uniref:hypothetical protein n=1 Tax=Leucobacter sp. NPDC058333 TaxID=3346450 RepID=UPI003668686F